MFYSLTQIHAIQRLFLFHTRTPYTVKEIRNMISKDQLIPFLDCEIAEEIANNH